MKLPQDVENIILALHKSGLQAYVVGGCVRDLLLARNPKDWDIATDATPEEILKIFPNGFYENAFGTVAIKTSNPDPTLAIVEVTTFRAEEGYSDKRRPDTVKFVKSLEEDLKRRDFTINALAIEIQNEKDKNQNNKSKFKIIDLFKGQNDLKNKIIRAVGNPEERFSEDALRLMRAVRFATELNFAIEEKTQDAIKKQSSLLRLIAKERIKDELEKIIMSANPSKGFEILRELGLLKNILPELEEGWGVTQNKHHIYTVWEHNLRSLQYAADQNYSLEVRLAALLHDVAKPHTKRGDGPNATFYGHEIIGSRMTMVALERLRFGKHVIEKVGLLIRAHMFNYDPDVVTDSSVRRLVAKVRPENIRELVELREADRIGSGVPKAVPYKLRHFMFRVEKVLKEFPSLKNLKVNGDDVMKILNTEPGPKIGMILSALFDEALDDPSKNEKSHLEKRVNELGAKSEQELRMLAAKARTKYEAVLESEEEEIKKKHYVK